MRHVILGLLIVSPDTLYGIQRRFAAGLAHIHGASFGSIHRALGQLVEGGEATVEDALGSRGRRIHRPTEAGRAAFGRWMHEPAAREDPETAILARVFLLGCLDDPAERRDVLVGLRRRAADARDTLAGLLDPAEGENLPAAAYARATWDHGLRSHDLMIAWLDELLDRELA